jgi:hypothetical protein
LNNKWKCTYDGKRIYVYNNPDGVKVYVDGKWGAKASPELTAAAILFAKNGGYAGMELGEFLKSVLHK